MKLDLFRRSQVGVSSGLVIVVLFVSYMSNAEAYMSGRLDTLLQADKTEFYSNKRIDEQAEINWRNSDATMSAGFQFELRHRKLDSLSEGDSQTDQQINQLFFKHISNELDLTLGRFNRADFLGFYSLDGLSAQYNGKSWHVNIHAGRPIKIENYQLIDANKIIGVDIQQHKQQSAYLMIKEINSSLAWQQIENEIKLNYINWGVSSKGEMPSKIFSQLELFFNGSYLIENKSAESINIGAQVFAKAKGLARLSYSSWKPEQATLSFKEQFYSVYANAKQSILQADVFHNIGWKQQLYFRGRKVWREQGEQGYGLTLGFEKEQTLKASAGYELQWDSLVLKEDSVHSFYMGVNKSVSSMLRGFFNTALQTKKGLFRSSRLLALEISAQKMLRSDLFIDAYGRYVFSSRLKNEYRFGFRLSYRFDDRIWSRQ